MNRTLMTAVIAGGLMVASAGAAKYFTPSRMMAESRPARPIAAMIPERFGDWTEDKSIANAVVDPQVAAELQRIYTQTVSRTYINSRGERIMLAIAYGRDQSDTSQVHYPEVCYPAQGFQMTRSDRGVLEIDKAHVLNVKRLETNLQQQRYEPITYWTTIGDRIVKGSFDKKFAEMSYGFRGTVPDGLLFRVSSIDRNSNNAFRVHEQFIRSLAEVLDPVARQRLLGLSQ